MFRKTFADISSQIVWGDENDAHEFFLALVQVAFPTTNTTCNLQEDLFVHVTQNGNKYF